MGAEVHETFSLRGRLRLELHDAETGELFAVRDSPNIIVTSGLNAIASALNWAFIQNYNTGWGSPFSSASGNLGDVFGAVGISNLPVTAADTSLNSEIGRELVTVGTNSSNVLTYQFFFPTTAGNGTIQEVGVLVNASSQQVTLTSGLIINNTYTSLAVTATTAVIPSGSTLIIGYGSSFFQLVVTSGSTAAGAVTINVTSFVANNTYPTATTVAYNSGTLLDHALLSPAVTKTNAQTATLSFSMTLQSA